MKRKSILAFAVVTVLLFCLPHMLFAQNNEEHRVALVIGNANYQVGKLANPENDARDVAEALKRSGFDVQLAVNRTLAQMEDDLRTFRASIQPGDVAMLYYAGHGVQVEGENYLLPVDNAGITDQNSLKRRAINAAEYIQAMADAGSRLNIVILDACRDNPLPAVARGGSRGLSVMRVPANTETVIVFATKAGELALDGTGRNSTFTEAFLEEVQKPDTELMQLFNSVGSRVREKTTGKQVPSIYAEPLSKPFVFLSSSQRAEQAEAASKKAQAELKAIEEAIAQLEAQIKNSKDAQERQKLEVEQQRQKALEAAKRLEAQNLAQEAARKQEEARKAQEQEALRQQAVLQSGAQQKEIADLAAKRRAELEKLAQDAQSDNPDVLIETIERLEAVINEVTSEYASAWKTVEPAIRKSYSAKLAVFETAKPELWETDAEFQARIKKEKADVQASIEAAVAQRKKELDADEELQIGSIRKQYADTIKMLESRTWVLQGSAVSLCSGDYDRNARKWPFTVASADPSVPLPGTQLYADLNKSADIKQAVLALDTAIKANALAGRIEWGIQRPGIKGYYVVILKRLAVIDLVSGKEVASLAQNQELGYFRSGARDKIQKAGTGIKKPGIIDFVSEVSGVSLYEQGSKLGDVPCQLLLSEGMHSIEARFPEGVRKVRQLNVVFGMTQRVVFEAPIISVATSISHTLFLKADGTLWATGRNTWGQLGDGTTTDRHTPVQVMRDVQAVAAGGGYTMILKTDGTLCATGNNEVGNLGDGTMANLSTPVQVMRNVQAVATGFWHTMILKTDGTLWATGMSDYGQLGDGTKKKRITPVQVMRDVQAVATGLDHTMILKTDGTLWATGNNDHGQLGDGTTANRSKPVQVMRDVQAVAAGFWHTMILKTDGTLWATGYNYYGQLGDGTTTNRSTLVLVMRDVKAVAAGGTHTMILKTDGTLWATGRNSNGRLGDGTTTNRSTPVLVMRDVLAVATGDSHTIILKTDGTLWAIGENKYGQLGDGTTTDRSTPVQISF